MEGHPEVFTLMNKEVPLPSKHSVDGKRIRLELLQEHFADIGSKLHKWAAGTHKDILDACALLWTAQNISLKREKRFPVELERDSLGLAMQIIA